MSNLPSETETLSLLIRWGESQPLVRAMLLTSTRAIPGASSDIFSDYDIILALSDVRPFAEARAWLEAFGKVLVMYQDPLESEAGCLHSGNVVQFESGLKIDFTLLQAEILGQIAARAQHAAPVGTQPVGPQSVGPQSVGAQPFDAQPVGALKRRIPSLNIVPLLAELDAGYRVLLDKDGLTDGLPSPTYRAYIPSPPTQAQYLQAIEVSLLDAVYVAKYLRRDDMMAAKFILENFLKHEQMRPLLEWHYEIDHGWSLRPGLYGRRMQQYLRPDLWSALESAYTGPGLEESWQALFLTLALLHQVALEVGERLGFAFPEDMERRALAYIQQVKDLDLG